MNSLILRTATGFLLPLMVLFSVFLLLRGHNEPGGGFVGGLVAAAGFALHAIAYQAEDTLKLLRVRPSQLIAAGLLAAAGSGLVSILCGKPFMTGLWIKVRVWGLGKVEVGTPLLFDFGVYLVVIGVTLGILLSLVEEAERRERGD